MSDVDMIVLGYHVFLGVVCFVIVTAAVLYEP